MWIFSEDGFYSVIQRKNKSDLTIRARVKGDLDVLREKYLPALSPTIEWAGSDYRYRAKASHSDFAEAMKKMASGVHYDNYKKRVAAKQGKRREQVYHAVWADLMHLERHIGG